MTLALLKVLFWTLLKALGAFLLFDIFAVIVLVMLDVFTTRLERGRRNESELDRQLRDPMPEYEERLYRQQLNPHSFNATKLVVCVVCGRPEALHERESHPFMPWERSDGDDR